MPDHPNPQNPELTPEQQVVQQFIDDTDELSKMPVFRRWLVHVLYDEKWCAAFASRVDLMNPNQTYFDAGLREVGVRLTDLMQGVAPKMFMRMLTESTSQRANYEEKRAPPAED